jgi:hypothetical protein
MWLTNAYFTHTLYTRYVAICRPTINGTHAQVCMVARGGVDQRLLHTHCTSLPVCVRGRPHWGDHEFLRAEPRRSVLARPWQRALDAVVRSNNIAVVGILVHSPCCCSDTCNTHTLLRRRCCAVKRTHGRRRRRSSSSMTVWACALVGVRRRRHFTQMLSGVDDPYTFSPSLCNQSVRVIRILVNSHVDLHSLSSTRVPRL